MPQSTESFRDPVHGYIDVFDWEKEIIDTPAFQRLRGIRQLGLTSYIYHGAEHSRFGHSIGVMHLAGRMAEKILRHPNNRELIKERQGWSEDEFEDNVDRVILEARLAGLLHDIGHAPFSHTGESSLFPPGKRHENFSEQIALSDDIGIGGIIDGRLKDWGITKERVVSIFSDNGIYEVGFVRELISSVWDVDKMDYLLRDSLYCGVQYGRYDLDRIIDTMTLYDEDPDGGLRLGMDHGGIHAIEGFILARYFMFTQVYFHKVRRAYDLILADFISELLQENHGIGHYPDSLDDYLQWTDWRVMASLTHKMNQPEMNLAWRINARQHPKPIYETGDHADTGVVNRALLRLPNELENKYPNIMIWVDSASDHPERFMMGDHTWFIRHRRDWLSLQRVSRALIGLDEIRQFRIYADVRGDGELEDEMERYCRDIMS